MALRACIYKNCNNYINFRDRTVNEHITLFHFPKNPERRQKWIENGKVPTNVSPTMYYFCSDHFDKRYLAVNNRRTILIGEAVPFAYVEQVIEETYDEDNLDSYLYEMNDCGSGDGELVKEHEVQNQDLHVESTTSMQDEQVMMQLIDTDFNVDHDQCSRTVLHKMKRKLNDSSVILTSASSSKPKIMKTSPPPKQQSPQKSIVIKSSTKLSSATPGIKSQITNPLESCNKELEIDPECLVDTQHVTTFIFKGEEYVQMSKDHYTKEKIELMKKLQNMERAVKAIKGHLNSLEL